MKHTHSGLASSLVLLALLWLPMVLYVVARLAVFFAARRFAIAERLVKGWSSAGNRTRAALLLMFSSAATHAALIPDHANDPVRAWLFALDSAALVLVAATALVGLPGWRPVARLLLACAVGAYFLYVAEGWETIDGVGILTKAVELVALFLLWMPADDPKSSPVRIRAEEM